MWTFEETIDFNRFQRQAQSPAYAADKRMLPLILITFTAHVQRCPPAPPPHPLACHTVVRVLNWQPSSLYNRPGGDGLLAQYGDCTAYVIEIAHCLAEVTGTLAPKNFRSQERKYHGMELLLPGAKVPRTFAPRNFRSLELLLPGAKVPGSKSFAPWSFRSLELSLPWVINN